MEHAEYLFVCYIISLFRYHNSYNPYHYYIIKFILHLDSNVNQYFFGKLLRKVLQKNLLQMQLLAMQIRNNFLAIFTLKGKCPLPSQHFGRTLPKGILIINNKRKISSKRSSYTANQTYLNFLFRAASDFFLRFTLGFS